MICWAENRVSLCSTDSGLHTDAESLMLPLGGEVHALEEGVQAGVGAEGVEGGPVVRAGVPSMPPSDSLKASVR